ncbi:hypothetical protein PCE1_001215 [Barthelona sp. PCE]
MATTSLTNMRRICIDKLSINIALGEASDKVVKAARVLEALTGQKPVFAKAKLTRRGFNVRRGEVIATYVTLRGKRAHNILTKILDVKDNSLPSSFFSKEGNFSFGIEEHIDIEGLSYDPSIGIHGMSVTVCLKRPGGRITKRRARRAKIAPQHHVTADEARQWFVEEFNGQLF